VDAREHPGGQEGEGGDINYIISGSTRANTLFCLVGDQRPRSPDPTIVAGSDLHGSQADFYGRRQQGEGAVPVLVKASGESSIPRSE
jgi:hypothetical protein